MAENFLRFYCREPLGIVHTVSMVSYGRQPRRSFKRRKGTVCAHAG